VELKHIVGKIAELIPVVDSTTQIQNINRRTKRPYVKGVKTLPEPKFVKELIKQWKKAGRGGTNLSYITDEFPYPDSNTTCDIVLTGPGLDLMLGSWEWAIEIKYLSLVGNNGSNNDYVMQKAISPYLKDRSLVHDIEKLKGASFAKRKAVIFYGFEFNSDSEAHAKEICKTVADSIGKTDYYIEAPDDPDKLDIFLKTDLLPTPKKLGAVIRSVEKAGNSYSLDKVAKIINDFLQINRISTGEQEVSTFEGLERHPCAQFGRVVGWEII
jgi:hypothetical protein